MAPSPETMAKLDSIARTGAAYAVRLLGGGSAMTEAGTVERVMVLSDGVN